jgi:predicted DsbA family dithiol-disulfide isomerase
MQENFEIDVRWWPFELHPETPKEGRNIAPLIRQEGRGPDFRQYLNDQAREAGITMRRRDTISNSHLALEAAEFARDSGRFDEMHGFLFRAYFEDGIDIGDSDALCAVAQSAGFEPSALQHSLATGQYTTLVDETTRIAREKGVHATPTFIFDDRLVVSGAQEYRLFEDVLTRLGATRKNKPGSRHRDPEEA